MLASEKYAGFNHSHLTEVLAEREGIHLSRQATPRKQALWKAVQQAKLQGVSFFAGPQGALLWYCSTGCWQL